MALTKVNRGGLNTGVSDSSNATFLTVDSSEQAVIKSEGGAVTTSVQQGLAKSWINMDGSGTVGISDSFNVSGISDDGTGQYQLQIANDMANADYSATTGLTRGGLANISFIDVGADWNASTGTVGFITADNSNTQFDPDCMTITVHGDLA